MAVLILPGLGAVLLASPVSAASTVGFQATFQRHFGQGAAPEPCSVDYCATGTVVGYGEATLSGTVTSFTPVPGQFSFCARITSSNTITLADGSTLVTAASGINCFDGNSHNAPGSSL